MKRWLAFMLMAMAITGCSTKNTAGLRVDSQGQKVMISDNVLGSRLQVENIATTDADGHARAVVTLASQYKGDQYIKYRFYWYDSDGLEVNAKLTPWKQQVVRGFETFSISEVSIHPNGKTFRVQIRQADK